MQIADSVDDLLSTKSEVIASTIPGEEMGIETLEESTEVVESGPSSAASTPSNTKQKPQADWSKYTPGMMRKPVSSILKRPSSAASSRTDDTDSLLSLKRRSIEREMEMREEEHEMRMSQQRAEHTERMALLASQQAELREKSTLHKFKMKMYKRKLCENVSSSDSESVCAENI